jgi:predicted Zn-dependent protease
VVNELSQLIDEQIQRNPGDGQMTLLRSDFLRRIGEYPNAISVLERFHKGNPNNAAISRVLAEALSIAGDLEGGIDILRATVLATTGDVIANLAFAKMLIKQNEEANANPILTYLRRSFSDGDTHYEARLLYARANLLYGDLKRGEAEFELLHKAYIQNRDKPTAPVELPGKGPKRFFGTVMSKKVGYAFLNCSELKFNVYFQKSSVTPEVWSTLDRGTPVIFTLAFTYRGPIAIDLLNNVEGH